MIERLYADGRNSCAQVASYFRSRNLSYLEMSNLVAARIEHRDEWKVDVSHG